MSRFKLPQFTHFVDLVLQNNGKVRYIEPFQQNSLFPGTANPSICFDENNNCFWLNIRKVSYTLHSTKKPFENSAAHWGALCYSICSDRGNLLETQNAVCKLKDPMNSDFRYKYIQEIERPHIWNFRNNEDVRLVCWNNKLYESYIIRDDNKTGVSRTWISELDTNSMKELNKQRLPASEKDTEYCVKNSQPIVDKPFNWVMLSNPTTVYNLNTNKFTRKQKIKTLHDQNFDMFRGSSQIIPLEDGTYLTIVHTAEMWWSPNKRKDARYLHCFLVYDKDFNIIKQSPLFSFNDMTIEFCCGMCKKYNKIYITFALLDNVSYILETDIDFINQFIDSKIVNKKNTKGIFSPNCTQKELFDYGMQLYDKKDLAGAYTYFLKSCDLFTDNYKEKFMLGRCIADLGKRDQFEQNLWIRAIMANENDPSCLMALAMYYYCRNDFAMAYYWGKKSMDNIQSYSGLYYTVDALNNLWNKIQQTNGPGIGMWTKAF